MNDPSDKHRTTVFGDCPCHNCKMGIRVVLLLIICVPTFLSFVQTQWHNRDSLPKEFQEIFATELDKVNVTEYWNASVGHGTRFSFTFRSKVPIEIKNESLYEREPVRDDSGASSKTSLYLERSSGDVTITLDQTRTSGSVRVQKPSVCALTVDGKRLHRLANFPWPNQVVEADEYSDRAWAKLQEAKGFEYCCMGAENLISVTHSIDPRDLPPQAFQRRILQLLSDLKDYNLQDSPGKVSEKLLQVHVPPSSLSEAQVEILHNIAVELSTHYAKPFDGRTWRIRSRDGSIPIRLKLFAEVTAPKAEP